MGEGVPLLNMLTSEMSDKLIDSVLKYEVKWMETC